MYLEEINNIPVIFIHRGFQEYLKYTISCAEEHHNRVVLLGSKENRNLTKEWYSISDYTSSLFEQFTKLYMHLSPNSKWFELVCFERYFLLLNFMKRSGINRSIMVDSDVLLFGEIAKIYMADEFDFGCGYDGKEELNPCVLYWNIDALENFVIFCYELYKDRNKRRMILDIYMRRKGEGKLKSEGGVSDMTLLYLWMKSSTYKYKDIFSENLRFFIDGNYNCAKQKDIRYKMKINREVKKILFIKNWPYVIEEKSKKRRKVVAIHCQGIAKKYVKLLYMRQAHAKRYLQLFM